MQTYFAKQITKRGGKIAGNIGKDFEDEISGSVITSNNTLSYEYIDKIIE